MTGRTVHPRRDMLLPAALDYAARGWHVFPLRPNDKRPAFPTHPADRCDPTSPDPRRSDARCRRAGRHIGWEQRATTDPDRITRAWQTTTPAGPYGIGIACGPSRLVVIDLDIPKGPDGAPVLTPELAAGPTGGPSGDGADPRPDRWRQPGITDGSDVLAALAAEARQPVPLGTTYTVRTASGGLHLYFTLPDQAHESAGEMRCTAGTLGWLIDTRAAGGYVVAPPSISAGNPYRIEWDAPCAPLPTWMADALTQAPRPAPGPVTARLRPVTADRAGPDRRRDAYLATAVARQCEHVATAAPGGRNRALYTSAVALGQLVAGGELDAAAVTAHLEQAAHTAGLEQLETTRTISSGLRAGEHRPRTLDTTGAAA